MSNRKLPLLFVFSLLLGLGTAPAALAGPFQPAEVSPSPQARQALDAHLYDYRVVELPLGALERAVRTQGRLDLVLRGRSYALDVERIDLRDPSYRAVLMTASGPVEVPRAQAATYAGHLADDPSATVRLTADRGMFLGYVRSADEWLFVDPLRDYLPGASRRLAVVYTEADVRPDAAGPCGAAGLHSAATKLGLPGDLGQKSHGTLRRVDIATDADGEYFGAYGTPGTFTRIQALINAVDGIYRSDVNLFFNITYQQAWTVAGTDPYTSTSIFTTLDQFRVYWNANRTGINRDVAHLFSAKNFSGNFIGVAYLAVVCNSASFSYGLSEDFGSQFLRTELLAHELGHNFAAEHDDQIGCSGVSCSGTGPIMCSVLQSSGSNTFSSCSISAIDNHTHNNGSCLN
jgi:hypothetical protein